MARREDGKEIPLQTRGVTEKRGRGRPRMPGAMTNAQRQAAFRARRKATANTVTVTENSPSPVGGHEDLVLECERLREALEKARRVATRAPRRAARDDAPHAAVDALARPLPGKGDQDDRRLALTLNGREFFSLERLAAHHGLPKRAVLERLIWWADHRIVQSFGEDDAAFNRYVDRVTKK